MHRWGRGTHDIGLASLLSRGFLELDVGDVGCGSRRERSLTLRLDTWGGEALVCDGADLKAGHGDVNLVCSDFVIGEAEAEFDCLSFLLVVSFWMKG